MAANRRESAVLPLPRGQDSPGSPQRNGQDGSARTLPAREGAFWVIVALAGPRFVGALTTIVLRRFLGPGVAGLFDLAFTPYSFLDGFRTIGTGPALVYQQDVDPDTANTAWTLNMLAAVLVAITAQLLAHPIAVYYERPAIEGVFRVLSIAYVLGSVGSVHFFLLLRSLDFRARSVPALGQVVVAGGAAVLLALWGFGIGALVGRQLASAGIGAVLLWAVYPYRPRLRLVPAIAWRLLRYGLWLSTAMTVLFVSQNVDLFIGGHVIRNTADIGFYSTSWSLAFLVAGLFGTISTSMVFPTLSRVQTDPHVLRLKMLKAIRQLGLALVPIALLVAALAPVLVVPVLGSKFAPYQRLFPVLSLLAVYAGCRTLLSIFFEGYKAIGKPQVVLVYNAIKLVVMVPLMLVGAQYGIEGLAATYIPIQVIEIPAALALAHYLLGISPGAMWRAARTWLVASAVMLGTVVACERALLSLLHASDMVTLAACTALGVALYALLVRALDRTALTEARGVLIRGL